MRNKTKTMMCGVLVGIIVLWITTAAWAGAKTTTVKGEVAETKDGVYVGGVLVPEEIFPAGKNLRNLAGQVVEIVGVVQTREDPAGPPGVIVQRREGSYRYMTQIDSVKTK